jgi:hypothetical protein
MDAEVDGVTTQKHVEEMPDDRPEHFETYEGRLIVAVLIAAV